MSVWISGFNGFGQITAQFSTVDSIVINCPTKVKPSPLYSFDVVKQLNAIKDPTSCATELVNSASQKTEVKSSLIIDVAIGWNKIYLLTDDGKLSVSKTCALTDREYGDSIMVSNGFFTTIGCGWTTVFAATRDNTDVMMWRMKDSINDTVANEPVSKFDFATRVVNICTNDATVFAVTSDRHLLSVDVENIATEAASPLICRPLLPELCIRTVSCGKHHVLVLSVIGVVFSHGNGSQGQLGHGSVESKLSPTVVEALEGVSVTSIAAGGWHSLAVTDAGDVYSWGWNERGQLGLPSYNVSGKSIDKVGLSSVKTCQADNQPDQLRRHSSDGVQKSADEFSDEEDATSPRFVNVLTYPHLVSLSALYDDVPVKKVAAGSRHSASLLEDGTVLTWGWNEYGQLGLGDTSSRDCPCVVQLFQSSNLCVTNVFAGWWNTVFITE